MNQGLLPPAFFHIGILLLLLLKRLLQNRLRLDYLSNKCFPTKNYFHANPPYVPACSKNMHTLTWRIRYFLASLIELSDACKINKTYCLFIAGRFSREAEFLSRNSAQPASYEHFGCDVRYTADGYPVRATDESQQAVIIPSPAESHKSISSASTAEPCCSTAKVQRTSYVPEDYSENMTRYIA